MTFFKRVLFRVGFAFSGLLFLGSLIGLIYIGLGSEEVESSPSLAVDRDIVDFGETVPQTFNAVFKLTNASRHSLEILRVVQSCGCTQVVFTRGTLAPGAESELRASFDTGTVQGTKTADIKIIYVSRGDKENQARMLPLLLRATVRPLEKRDESN